MSLMNYPGAAFKRRRRSIVQCTSINT